MQNISGTLGGVRTGTVVGWRSGHRVFALPRSIERFASAPWVRAALLLGCAVAIQFAVGAYRVGFGSYSDEPTHFLNALVLRDYLTTAFGRDPIAFASDFYLSYPKIAPFVWPPLFHVVLGIFLLPGWAPHPAALGFVALIATATAWRLSVFIAELDSSYSARLLPFAFLAIPLIVEGQSVVMVDLAVAMTALEAAWWLYRYIAEPRMKFAVLFGLWSAACCLCKGNGVAVLLLPPVVFLLIGRPRFVLAAGVRVAAVIVAVLAGPFVYISYRICAGMDDFTGTHLLNFEHRLRFFSLVMWSQVTPLTLMLVFVAGAVLVTRSRRSPLSGPAIAAASLFGLAVVGVAFHVLLPLAFVHGPYVTLAIAPVIGLVPFGAETIAKYATPKHHRISKELLISLTVAALLITGLGVQGRRSLGYTEAVDYLSGVLPGTRFLIVSDPQGEGAFVAEVAKRRPTPRALVIRSSKLLVDENWMGATSRLLFSSPADTLKLLQDLHVEYVVIDNSPSARSLPYWSHMQTVVGGGGFSRVSVVERSARVRRSITTYRVLELSDGPPKPIQLNALRLSPIPFSSTVR